MNRPLKIALWGIGIPMTVLAMVLGAIVFWVYLLEIDDATPGSVAYIVGIPDYAKSVPLLKPCAPPLYGYRAMDGTMDGYAFIEFGTSAPLSETLAYYRAFMDPRDCPFYINEKGDTLGTKGPCQAKDIWDFSVTQSPSNTGCFPVAIDLSGGE
jgi:hypothetical protein